MKTDGTSTKIVTDFEERYPKEYDFYDQAARLIAQVLEQHFQRAGIRAIVTSRAKSPVRAVEKAIQRAEKTPYTLIDDIYHDIVDLAGVRVALYFPGERDQVDKIIKQYFYIDDEPKQFPSSVKPTYEKRFSGYWATHYRVRLPDPTLNESQKRYSEALIEIQVASILMHAWAEVEHDLVYKPLQGRLSQDEYAILDEINGLVLSGEIALERLQRAGERRVATAGRVFSNHYDLAAYLLDPHSPDEGTNLSVLTAVLG
jgi:ppGpp synthetase/RelA/SpoT-type nucleotidyltranferase